MHQSQIQIHFQFWQGLCNLLPFQVLWCYLQLPEVLELFHHHLHHLPTSFDTKNRNVHQKQDSWWKLNASITRYLPHLYLRSPVQTFVEMPARKWPRTIMPNSYFIKGFKILRNIQCETIGLTRFKIIGFIVKRYFFWSFPIEIINLNKDICICTSTTCIGCEYLNNSYYEAFNFKKCHLKEDLYIYNDSLE